MDGLLIVGLVSGLLYGLSGTLSLGAQPTRAGSNVEGQLATITTDTGAFAPGRRDWTNYKTPSFCLAAARWTSHLERGSVEAQALIDSLQHAKLPDTVGATHTMAVARTCGAHFTIAGGAARDLDDLFDLAIVMQDDALTQAVLAKRVSRQTTAADSLTMWREALWTFMNAIPARVVAAATLLASVDAMGESREHAQYELHGAEMIFAPASAHTFITDAKRVMAIGLHGVTHKDSVLTGTGLYNKFAVFVLLQDAYERDPNSVPTLERQALQLFGSDAPWNDPANDVIRTIVEPREKNRLAHRDTLPLVPPLRTDYWFPAPGQMGRDTVHPTPGKVNLICAGAALDGWLPVREDGGTNDNLYTGLSARFYPQLRHLIAEFGPAGLDVTVVYPAREGTDSVPTWVAPAYHPDAWPQEEAEFWRWYVQEYQHVPVAVAIQTKHSQWTPAPFGFRAHESNSQFSVYWEIDNGAIGNGDVDHAGCVLVDQDGHFVDRVRDIDESKDNYIVKEIQQLLAPRPVNGLTGVDGTAPVAPSTASPIAPSASPDVPHTAARISTNGSE